MVHVGPSLVTLLSFCHAVFAHDHNAGDELCQECEAIDRQRKPAYQLEDATPPPRRPYRLRTPVVLLSKFNDKNLTAAARSVSCMARAM